MALNRYVVELMKKNSIEFVSNENHFRFIGSTIYNGHSFGVQQRKISRVGQTTAKATGTEFTCFDIQSNDTYVGHFGGLLSLASI